MNKGRSQGCAFVLDIYSFLLDEIFMRCKTQKFNIYIMRFWKNDLKILKPFGAFLCLIPFVYDIKQDAFLNAKLYKMKVILST